MFGALGVAVYLGHLAEVFDDPQIRHRGMRIDRDGVPGVRAPFRFSDAELALDHASPKLGEHTATVLARLRGETPD